PEVEYFVSVVKHVLLTLTPIHFQSSESIARPRRPEAEYCVSVVKHVPEAEYVVSVVKHVFPAHIVLHFTIKNTMEEQQMEQVTVEVDLEGGAKVQASVPAEAIKYQAPGMALVCIKRPSDGMDAISVKSCKLTFIVKEDGSDAISVKSCKLTFIGKEVDPASQEVSEEGENEEYPLDDIE
ncbi:Coatomer/clathrin adaptor appendage, Ig-like subdomain-containing protein, partial [Baffinella frigidus]